MKKIVAAFALLMFAVTMGFAQDKGIVVDIWPDGLPNTNGVDLPQPFDDATGNYKPQITVYLPEKSKATGQAVLCIPGGGYGVVCYDTEGFNWVPYFLDHGIAIAVLKYRLPHGQSAVPGSDAMEAMRILRRNAGKWGFSPDKIGVMGHSAGGHLCATVATHATGDARPNFQILMYPVITMDKTFTHMGTHNSLIGENPSAEVENYFSLEKQVKPGQSPAIIFVTDDDRIVPVENSVVYYQALHKAGIPASLHIYRSGDHGFSCHKNFKWHEGEMVDLFKWLGDLNNK